MSINYKELRLLRRSWENDADMRPRMPFFWPIMAILTIIILIAGCQVAHAGISEAQGVACVIGEAEAEGYEGMLAVSYALQRRGTTKGVYGCKAPRVLKHKYSYITYMEASKAWEYAQLNPADDITNEATGWGSVSDVNKFKRTKWWKNCIITARIGNHIFYRERWKS